MNNTKQRQLILETVQGSFAHPTADEIFRSVRQKMPNISLGTVYRNLSVLADIGSIRRIAVPGQADRFDRQSAWHDHMVCEKCGKVLDITLDGKPTLAEQIAAQAGITVTGYSLVAQCVCPDCDKQALH